MAFGGRRGSSRWALPVARSETLGKLGPSFGIGAGCGVGVGIGFIGALPGYRPSPPPCSLLPPPARAAQPMLTRAPARSSQRRSAAHARWNRSKGAGIGAGFPGLQLGFGAGAGCGIGVGYGYGFGKGIAYDENGRYSNIRRSYANSRSLPYDQEFDILLDEIMESTRKLIKATSKEIDKWRRM